MQAVPPKDAAPAGQASQLPSAPGASPAAQGPSSSLMARRMSRTSWAGTSISFAIQWDWAMGTIQ